MSYQLKVICSFIYLFKHIYVYICAFTLYEKGSLTHLELSALWLSTPSKPPRSSCSYLSQHLVAVYVHPNSAWVLEIQIPVFMLMFQIPLPSYPLGHLPPGLFTLENDFLFSAKCFNPASDVLPVSLLGSILVG